MRDEAIYIFETTEETRVNGSIRYSSPSVEQAPAFLTTMADRSQLHSARSAGSGSVQSYKSSGSRRYRRVAQDADVDESLFGSRTRTTRNAGKSIVREKNTARSNQQSHEARGRSRGAPPKQVQVLSSSELHRIRNNTTIITAAEMEDIQAQKEAEQEVLRMKAKARKQHMLKKSVEAAKRAPKSEIEQIFEAEKEQVLIRASELKNQAHDSIKLLKTLGARAEAFTMRDEQIREQSTRGLDDKLYDEKMNLMMEVDRLQDLERQEKLEESKRQKRIADRIVLEQQIEERRKEQERQRQVIAAEGELMLQNLREEQLRDSQHERDRILKSKKSMEEVMKFNEQAMARKMAEAEKIREEERKIEEYQRLKAEEQRLREEEEERKKQEAELMLAKMRARQEKVANRKAELDELQAKRAAESRERAAREAEIALEKRRQRNMEDLRVARTRQAAAKQRALEQEAEQQQREYESILVRIQQDKDRLEKEESTKKTLRDEHRAVLQQQIEQAQLKRKELFASTQQEGRRLRDEYDEELTKLQELQLREVKALEARGVNPRYLSEMKSLDMAKIRNC